MRNRKGENRKPKKLTSAAHLKPPTCRSLLDLSEDAERSIIRARDNACSKGERFWVIYNQVLLFAIVIPLASAINRGSLFGVAFVLVIFGGNMLSSLLVGNTWRFGLAPSRQITDKWRDSLSFWIPRRYREGVMRDLMEDSEEIRALGKSEWRVRAHLVWHLGIGILHFWPAALKAAIWAAVGAMARKLL